MTRRCGELKSESGQLRIMPRVLQQSTEPEKGIGALVETQPPKEESKMLCTVLSCHIGHGMTRTNQKCNSHLQSMSHATWMFLNVCIVEALRIKTECLAVQFRVQLLHGSGALTSSSYDLSL